MHAYNATRGLAGRSMFATRTTNGVPLTRNIINKPAGYYRANSTILLRTYNSNSNISFNASESQQLANDNDSKPCKDDSSLNLDDKLIPIERHLPSTPVLVSSRSNGRRRQHRILSHGGNDNNNNDNSNNSGNNNNAAKSIQSDIATNHKQYLQLAVSINDQTIQKCLLQQTEAESSTQNWLHLAPKKFCKELTLAVKSALRSHIDPATTVTSNVTAASSSSSSSSSNQGIAAWYNVRDHIALRPSTRNTTPLLINTVQETAKELNIDVCQLNPWILQELFDPLITSSDDLWPVYPRRAHDNSLAAMDDAFIEADNDEYNMEEGDEEELDHDNDEAINEEEEEEEEDDDDDDIGSVSSITNTSATANMRQANSIAFHSPYASKNISNLNEQSLGSIITSALFDAQSATSTMSGLTTRLARKPNMKQPTLEDKMTATFHQLFIRLMSLSASSSSSSSSTNYKPLLIHLTDAIDLGRTKIGQPALYALLRAIHNVRREGMRVALIASCNDSEVFPSDLDLSASFNGGAGIWDAFIPMRVPSTTNAINEGDTDASVTLTKEAIEAARVMITSRWKAQQQQRIAELNIHNMKRMLRQRNVLSALTENKEAIPEITDELWPYDRVVRVVNTAIGLAEQSHESSARSTDKPLVTSEEIIEAVAIVKGNTTYAMETVEEEVIDPSNEGKTWQTLAMERHAQKLQRGKFNIYEQRLVDCLVNPGSTKVSFKDVIAAPSTIRALQTLISLPLLYPDHFNHGVLSDHALTGILLFGPPGTGKTMLAKAVAAESGSSMLEIKGSDIYDKYVGESEKNVKAIFSIARKMAPCVIFIDEVDALFASRGSDLGGGSGKRETVNQFMAEWDGLRSGLHNRGVTVLCATNRPFDLDDAVLRRMPRRILVDLPSMEDRQRILDKHLANEKLEDGMTSLELARKTPLYSGSDLKNLCVTAALAAIREQVAGITDTQQLDPLDFDLLHQQQQQQQMQQMHEPADRVLMRKHFELALKEIAPSSSEEMQTLTELRRWDRLYGDSGNLTRRRPFRRFGFTADTNAPEASEMVPIVPIPNADTASTANTDHHPSV